MDGVDPVRLVWGVCAGDRVGSWSAVVFGGVPDEVVSGAQPAGTEEHVMALEPGSFTPNNADSADDFRSL